MNRLATIVGAVVVLGGAGIATAAAGGMFGDSGTAASPEAAAPSNTETATAPATPPTTVSAATAPAPTSPTPEPPEVQYTRAMGISVEAAREALAMQSKINVGPLYVEGRTAAIWTTPRPELHVVAWYTGGDEGLESAREAAKDIPVPVEFRTDAPYDEAGFVAIAAEAVDSLGDDAGLAGSGFFPTRGAIVIMLQPFSRLAGHEAETAAELEARFGVPFEVETRTSVAGDD